MNKIMLIVVSLLIAGCDSEPGDSDSTRKIACIDGVKYVYFRGVSGNQGFGYMSVKLNRGGKVEHCDLYPALLPQ